MSQCASLDNQYSGFGVEGKEAVLFSLTALTVAT
jgi:hypothetical protein